MDWKPILFVCGTFLSGCSLINPEESLPIYVQIEDAEVLVDENRQVWSPLGIRDTWVFLQNEQIGVFELPTVFPILAEPGETSLRIGGGVFETGLSGFRREYPFWNDINVSIEGVNPLDTLTIRPRFEYFPRDTTLVYAFEEGFEGASVVLENVSLTGNFTQIRQSTERAYTGLRSGKVTFSPDKYIFEASSPVLGLPQTGNNDIWCEVTYWNDIAFSVLLVGVAPGSVLETELPTNVVFVSPDGWKTAYIHLNDLARSLPQGAAFKLLFRASSFDKEIQSGRSGTIFLDHIRLIHFRG